MKFVRKFKKEVGGRETVIKGVNRIKVHHMHVQSITMKPLSGNK